MRYPIYTEEHMQQAEALYRDGCSLKAVAQITGISVTTLSRRLRSMGTEMRPFPLIREHPDVQEKLCPRCGTIKPIGDLSWSAASPVTGRPVYGYCKECRVKHSRSVVEGRQGRHKYLVRLYGLTLDDFEAMAEEQEGRCLICSKEPLRGLVVDHNHATGHVRGLLCHTCNSAIGLLGDNSLIADRAAEYLRSKEAN